MNTRFDIDLLHPGWVAQTWQDWFTGPRGWRRLAWFALGGAVALLVILVAGLLPTYWRLSSDRSAVPALRRDLAARDADLGRLRSNLQALAREARRQLHWAPLMTLLSQQIPPALKLQLVETARAAPPAAPPASAKTEETLRIEALTPLRPGSAPLVDVAQFMGALMRDPAVNSRFVLKSWEIKPTATAAPSGEALLSVSIVLAERPQ